MSTNTDPKLVLTSLKVQSGLTHTSSTETRDFMSSADYQSYVCRVDQPYFELSHSQFPQMDFGNEISLTHVAEIASYGQRLLIRNSSPDDIQNVQVLDASGNIVFQGGDMPSGTDVMVLAALDVSDQLRLSWDSGEYGIPGRSGEVIEACTGDTPGPIDVDCPPSDDVEMPAKYEYELDTDALTLIIFPEDGSAPILIDNTRIGRNMIELPEGLHGVVITNFIPSGQDPQDGGDMNDPVKQPRTIDDLPLTTNELIVFGSGEIDTRGRQTAELELTFNTPYASVMVAINDYLALEPAPMLNGNPLELVSPEWFNIFTREQGMQTLEMQNLEGEVITEEGEFQPEVTYRYALGAKDGGVDSGIDVNYNTSIFDCVVDKEVAQ